MAIDLHSTDLRMVRASDGLDLDLAPLQGLWSAEQYLRLTADTNALIEYANGEIEVLPIST